MAVTPITAAVKIRLYADFDAVAPGGGSVMMGGLNANDPGQGQSLYPIAAGNAQTMRLQVAELILGYNGSITLAEIDTALKQLADDLAGSTGTPIITAATLATINGWATGNP